MIRAPRPVFLGLFVLAGLLIGFGLLIVLASGRFLSDREIYVMTFDGNVDGLDVGSPVLYQGFRVGRVTEMRLILNPETGDARLPVFVGLEPDRLRLENGGNLKDLSAALTRELHAKLYSQSLVTGQMAIQLVEAEETEAVTRSGVEYGVPEIATVANLRQSLIRTLQEAPLEEMLENLRGVVESLGRIAEEGTIRQTLASVSSTAERADGLVATLETSVPETLEAWKRLGRDLRRTRNELDKTLKDVSRNLSPGTPTHRKLLEAVDQVDQTARSIEALTDYLQRHPEALLKGRDSPGESP